MTHTSNGGPIVEKTSPRGADQLRHRRRDDRHPGRQQRRHEQPDEHEAERDSASGLIVVAFEDTTKRYWHADIFGGGGVRPDRRRRSPRAARRRAPADVGVGTDATATFSEPVTGRQRIHVHPRGPGRHGRSRPPSPTTAPSRTATLDPTRASRRERRTPCACCPASRTWPATTWPRSRGPSPRSRPTRRADGHGRDPALRRDRCRRRDDRDATFSEAVTGVAGTTMTLQGPGATPVGATVTYDGPSRTATLDPNGESRPTRPTRLAC